MSLKFAQDMHVIPVMSPADITTTATNTTHISVSGAHRVTFMLHAGVITGDSCTITVEESTSAATTSAAAIPFKYRLSAAVAADTWGAVTTADSSGVVISATDDGKILLIEVDPSSMSASQEYLSVLITPEASMSAFIIGAVAYLEPRYSQLDMVSST